MKKFRARITDSTGDYLAKETAEFDFEYVGKLKFANSESVEFKLLRSCITIYVKVFDFMGNPIFHSVIQDPNAKSGETIKFEKGTLTWQLNYKK